MAANAPPARRAAARRAVSISLCYLAAALLPAAAGSVTAPAEAEECPPPGAAEPHDEELGLLRNSLLQARFSQGRGAAAPRAAALGAHEPQAVEAALQAPLPTAADADAPSGGERPPAPRRAPSAAQPPGAGGGQAVAPAVATLPPAGGCAHGLTPLHLQVQLDSLKAVGSLPRQGPCADGPAHGLSAASAAAWRAPEPRSVRLQRWLLGGLQGPVAIFPAFSPRGTAFLLIGLFVTFHLVCALAMRPCSEPQPHAAPPCKGGKRGEGAGAEEKAAAGQSLPSWLSASWAMEWGGPAAVAAGRVPAAALPRLGSEDDRARPCAGEVERLWLEEVASAGEGNASIGRVIVRMWSARTLCCMLCLHAGQVLLTQVFSVVLVEQALLYFHWLRDFHGAGRDVTEGAPNMTLPLVAAIGAFSSLPLGNAVLSSAIGRASCRTDQRVCGGLMVALFRKAQRLPAHGHAEGQERAIPEVTQLMSTDVGGNLLGAGPQACQCLCACAALALLAAMLCARLGLAALAALAALAPLACGAAACAAGLGAAAARFQMCMDTRTGLLREAVCSIRAIRCSAAEEAMEARVAAARREELEGISGFFRRLGALTAVLAAAPRILVLASLWGHLAVYGRPDAATIFACLQILASMKMSLDTLSRGASRLSTIRPSLRRLEAYLGLQEAAVALPEKAPPAWLELWPRDGGGARPSPAGGLEATPPPPQVREDAPPAALRLHGSFAWLPGGRPALFDLAFEAPRGELVGVVGGTGAGKSAFLQALLGELTPDSSTRVAARLCRPGSPAAYCPQVPHIVDGTLRDNVLFGQPFDEQRYGEALSAACLHEDLRHLPGGDGAHVGAGGVALSGGQRARVALARAAYNRDAELVVVDDPFSALDARTAKSVFESMVLGRSMRGRTRVVAMQPSLDQALRCDRLVVLGHGRVLAQGPPEEVVTTQAFRLLLGPRGEEPCPAQQPAEGPPAIGGDRGRPRQQLLPWQQEGGCCSARVKLRDDELGGKLAWEVVKEYCRFGHWRNAACSWLLFCMQVLVFLLCDLVLARWANDLSVGSSKGDGAYLRRYLLWLCAGGACFAASWKFGECFTMRASSRIHSTLVGRIFRAPIDRFFDKQPAGRIVSRLSADMAAVDLFLFLKVSAVLGVACQVLLPLLYVHLIMPWCITLLTAPLYQLLRTLCSRFWHASVLLKHCARASSAQASCLVLDFAQNAAVARACQDQERASTEVAAAVDEQLRASLLADRALRRWLCNRLLLLWNFFTVSVYIVCIMNPGAVGVGTLGLSITVLVLLQQIAEASADTIASAQFELISLARLLEYLHIPQERPAHLQGDARRSGFLVSVGRGELGPLAVAESCRGVEVLRGKKVLLRDALGGTGLAAPALAGPSTGAPLQSLHSALAVSGAGGDRPPRLGDLCPSCPALGAAPSGHYVAAVDAATGDAAEMARQLCGGGGSSVLLDVRSAWLSEGAHIRLEDLKVGYGDIPRDVLRGITLDIPPRSKVAIVGATGSGKSTLLLALLRVLEPRAGRVLLGGADASDLGLAALRAAFGFVPQDPVLFSGTLRSNLDPLGAYPDTSLWEALRCAGIAGLVESQPLQLRQPVAEEGGNLSLGQRRLVCLARAALRRPPALLLDEAAPSADPRSQEALQKTIRSGFAASTVLAVTHPMASIADFDRAVVIDRGLVAEQGPVKELCENQGGRLSRMLAAASGGQ